ncbi:BNR-repeat neuraminidase N-terminal domain-containing protein, partial [Phocaeicola plebeius]
MTKCGVLLFILLQVGILYAADLEIKFSRAVLPVLAGESINHVGYVRVIKKELSANQRLTGLSYSFSGTTCLNELESLALYECNSKGVINKNKLFAISDVISENGYLRINIPIHSDTCYWAFSVKVKRCVSLSSRINFNCTEMSFNNK